MSKLRALSLLILTAALGLSVATYAASDSAKAAATTNTTSEKAPGTGRNFVPHEKLKPGEKMNINTATVDDLQKIKGIGEKKAKAIVEYRTKNGNFKTVNDIMSVKCRGINQHWFDRASEQLTV